MPLILAMQDQVQAFLAEGWPDLPAFPTEEN
jgi:hypothetical protein